MRGTAASTYHNCGKTWLSGCVIVMTCDGCREKGHDDGFLDCPACKKEHQDAMHKAITAVAGENNRLRRKLVRHSCDCSQPHNEIDPEAHRADCTYRITMNAEA